MVLMTLVALISAADTLSPRQVMIRFDSLLQSGAEKEARALCTGGALRMFPALAQAQARLSSFIDTAKSRDTVLEEKCGGKWCALKIASEAVFVKPMMGMDRIKAVQVAHLFRQTEGWRLAEFEELPDRNTAFKVRQGDPGLSDSASALFPVSVLAPIQRGADRVRLEIWLQSGDTLNLPEGAGQHLVKKDGKRYFLEMSRPDLPDEYRQSNQKLFPSSAYLDVKDSLLLAKAAELNRGARGDLEITRRIYEFVSRTFQFQLGAAMFGTSREALRQMRGDCSEAAVLTAALLRATGIDSRVVLGYATLGHGVFIGHAWTEAKIGDRWMGVDAALKEFPAGANRLMLLRLNGSEEMRVTASNLMLKSLSNLRIEIIGAWKGDKALPLEKNPGNAAEAREFFEQVLQGIGR